MTSAQPNQELVLLLPQLKADCDVKASNQAGKWDLQGSKAFADVASSLDYQAPGEVKSISSVPTMWARPLTMEMALQNLAHPLRQQMVEQWQGMLAVIALAEVRGFPMSAQLVELGELKYEEFADSLFELLPDCERSTLYTQEEKHPWQDIYIFLWNEQPVGMTSPSTLVVPSEEGDWTGLPWWNEKQKILQGPQRFLNESEQALLFRWLENLRKKLPDYNGNKKAIDVMGGLIDEFRGSLKRNPDLPLILSDDLQFFGVPINRGVLEVLNRPLKAQEKDSNVRLIPSREKAGKAPLLIIDPEIAKTWNIPPQNVWVHGGKTLASLEIEDLKKGKLIWPDVRWIESHELFLPEFVFIDQQDALPGTFPPKTTEPLAFNGQQITPLIPLNPILLDYFTPEDLIDRIKLQPFTSSEGAQVRVILDLPLTGVNEDKSSENLRLYKDYPINEENALSEVPVLEVWPYFQVQGWKEYYTFYYDGEYGDATFQVSLPEARDSHSFKEGLGRYQMVRLENFPECIHCQNSERTLIGLILLKTPEEIQLRGSWQVGVDFGTSFTNVYVNSSDIPERLELENLHLKVTESNIETRLNVLYENFIPEDFIPAEKPLPLSSVLTIKGSLNSDNKISLPFLDGRIYIPNQKFKPQQEWIKTDLKWLKENLLYNQLFLKHLALHITAIAAQTGISQIQWSLSYPSAFSRWDKKRYAKVWQDLIKELEDKTGIKHNSPQINSDNLRTESLAVAQYFRDFEDHNLVNTTCIDMGGGTSDISIWEENSLVHQCSVQLAGRDIFSQFLEMNPQFIEKSFEVNLSEWKGLRGGAFNAKLDVLLRLEGDHWLNNKKDFVEDEEDFQGLIRLTAIGTAGLYYYVGIILKVLYDEEKYSRDEITPVYIGGNGSRFLNWLAEGGRFDNFSEVNYLLSQMLSKGSGFEDTEEITRLSQNPKDEAACGLVLRETKLTGLEKKAKDPLIAGETCLVNKNEIFWNSRLEVEGDVKEFKIPHLVQLPQFLYDFHVALQDLELEGITPLRGYTRSRDLDQNSKLWRNTQKELTDLLQKMKGDSENIRLEPPFILGLKALLQVLGKEWAGR
ncbi:MAG: hypothetical protein AB4426_31340 [Xenococcaceae cyanobacterium]